jgi:hypothetical protein
MYVLIQLCALFDDDISNVKIILPSNDDDRTQMVQETVQKQAILVHLTPQPVCAATQILLMDLSCDRRSTT